MSNFYDESVRYFIEVPGEIEEAWLYPERHKYGCLFRYLTPDGRPGKRADGEECGDPIQVKSYDCWTDGYPIVAWTNELTSAIRSNELIPRYFGSMLPHARIAALPVIADAQRLADRMLNRREPNTAYLTFGAWI